MTKIYCGDWKKVDKKVNRFIDFCLKHPWLSPEKACGHSLPGMRESSGQFRLSDIFALS